MLPQRTIKDRDGADVAIGDYVFYLEGSVAGDNYYETGGEVIDINTRSRVVKVDTGEHKFWYEIWKEQQH